MSIPSRMLPKVSLHCHPTGSVLPGTVLDPARKYGVAPPGGRGAADLYDIDSHEVVDEFLRAGGASRIAAHRPDQ
ncbi:hypothetical protein GPX89_37120 [Nocardia sp. ET3-3]|uniref:Adenosine deaminase n=1 Tax=Nocardia terrae TaxID=2675851 RepID=A0A7K1V855_9NOCA|nr:hypothetical protein [Nocardia terrae]MVU82844.1 hypothetical protein [Nocardia terrae]